MHSFLKTTIFILAALAVKTSSFGSELSTVKPGQDGIMTVDGIITPIDLNMNHFYLRNADGQIEVKLTDATKVGLQERIQRDGFEKRVFEYQVGSKVYSYPLPKDLYIRYRFYDWQRASFALANPDRTLWGGKIYITPLPDHLPTENELYLTGKMTAVNGREKTVEISGKTFKIATTGHNGQERFMGLVGKKDIKPYIQRAFVYGKLDGTVFLADEICIMRKEDPGANDDPSLPRVLFIGDSISGNYDRAFRHALDGKANIYHPPVNCGPATNGADNIVPWLGPYDQKGYHWDVISFNFGQWDLSKGSKETYQAALTVVIDELVKTRAELIFVTTTPIPGGYGEVADKPVVMKKGRNGTDETWVPGKHKGVMKKYINPWAREVITKYPQIKICDQHAILWHEKSSGDWLKLGGTNRRDGIEDETVKNDYGDNHIPGMQSQIIGRLLARQVLDVLDKDEEALNPLEINSRDFGPEARATNRGIDHADFSDLVHNNDRLRKYNSK